MGEMILMVCFVGMVLKFVFDVSFWDGGLIGLFGFWGLLVVCVVVVV